MLVHAAEVNNENNTKESSVQTILNWRCWAWFRQKAI